jgi:hypothetical protein
MLSIFAQAGVRRLGVHYKGVFWTAILSFFVSFLSNYGYPAHVCWMQAPMGYRVQGVYTVTGNKKF